MEVYSAAISTAWEGDDQTHIVGRKGSPSVVYSGAGQDPDDNKPPNWNGSPLLDGDFLSCSRRRIRCFQTSKILEIDPDIIIEPDTGEPLDKRDERWVNVLDPRGTGEGRPFTVRTPSGATFIITSHKVRRL